MSDEEKDINFQDSIKKLRSLREELCSKQRIWNDAFRVRDFVVGELQDMYVRLKSDSESPAWCVKKTEVILSELSALPDDEGGQNDG
tara:strand:- start:116 stop:376 length:261 start_codon:yes stop_codon:yes gene_type:complete